MLHAPAFFCLFRSSHWWHPMEKSEYQPKEALFEEVFEPDKGQGPNAVDSVVHKKFKCLLCLRMLSSKQRVLTHLHTAHQLKK